MREQAIRERERAAEALYLAAVEAAKRDLTHTEQLDAIEAALKAGACPTRALTEKAFEGVRCSTRFRELIRDHAHQSEISMLLENEPGELLHVSGVVKDQAGRPVHNALVFVYHTNASGLYNPHGMDESNPRLFGYMRTDEHGRYAFRTIRPGAYPDQREPVEQHIHMILVAEQCKDLETRIGFADDPFWAGRTPPKWAAQVSRNERGEFVCTRDVELHRSIAESAKPAARQS
jgi:protocatechuate 3,4-dioxygenase beta subunit